jgi:rhodanese-related sulfurtransferase
VTALLAVGAVGLLAACSDSESSDPVAEARDEAVAEEGPSIVDQVEGATIVDVRTPAEFDDGHLEGAVNIDVQDASFDQRIAELPTDGTYFVYCRSGNRSAAAVERMRELGFTDVVDGGGFEALVAAGLPAA